MLLRIVWTILKWKYYFVEFKFNWSRTEIQSLVIPDCLTHKNKNHFCDSLFLIGWDIGERSVLKIYTTTIYKMRKVFQMIRYNRNETNCLVGFVSIKWILLYSFSQLIGSFPIILHAMLHMGLRNLILLVWDFRKKLSWAPKYKRGYRIVVADCHGSISCIYSMLTDFHINTRCPICFTFELFTSQNIL